MSLSNLFDRLLAKPSVALAIVSDPGHGKSSMVEEWAKERNLPMVKLLASTMAEEDVAGIIVRENDSARTLSPEWYKQLKDGPACLFMDELNTCRREVADTLLTLVASRHLPNGDKLHDGVVIIACMNDAEICDCYELSPAMRNRFMWVTHRLTEKEWLAWFERQPEFSDDKKLLMREAVQRGFQFDRDKAFIEKPVPTSPRSVTKLAEFSETAEEMVKWATAFVDDEAATVLKSVKVECYATTANSIFKNNRTQTAATPEEAERLAQQSDVLNKIQRAAQKTK